MKRLNSSLLFSDTLHDYLTEYDLAHTRTIHSQQTTTTTKPHNSNRTHPPTTHRMDPGSGTNSKWTQAQSPRGVTVGTNLNKRALPPPPLSYK
eukprot:scaffold2188_cov102-Isochrysis_galbana.AAC.9